MGDCLFPVHCRIKAFIILLNIQFVYKLGGESLEHRITDIHCPQCGAPADFDIVRQMYVCGHCGGTVGISEAQKEKQGFIPEIAEGEAQELCKEVSALQHVLQRLRRGSGVRGE